MGFLGDAPGLYGKPLISFRKRWRWVDFMFDVSGGAVTISIDWIEGDNPDDNAAANGTANLTLPFSPVEANNNSVLETSANTIISLIGGGATLRAALEDITGRYPTSRGLRLRVRSVSQGGQWFLNAIDTAYQLLPGQKRSLLGRP